MGQIKKKNKNKARTWKQRRYWVIAHLKKFLMALKLESARRLKLR